MSAGIFLRIFLYLAKSHENRSENGFFQSIQKVSSSVLTENVPWKCNNHHSLLRRMAAQKQEKQSSKNEKYTQLQKKNQKKKNSKIKIRIH